MPKKYVIKMKKKYLFVSCREGVSSIFSREHPLFPFFFLLFSSFYLFSLISYFLSFICHLSFLISNLLRLSHFSFIICHPSFLISNFSFVIYKIVLKMKSYENLMQNIRLLQKEVLLLHLI